MKIRSIAAALAAVITAAVLSGCAQKAVDVPVFPISAPTSSSSSSNSTTSSSRKFPTLFPSSSSAASSTTFSTTTSTSTSTISSSEEPFVPVITTREPEIEPPEIYTYNSLLENYRAKWGYNQLNAKQQKVYERLYKAAESSSRAEVNVQDLGVKTDDVDIAYWAFDYDNPQFLELGSGYQMKVYADERTRPASVIILYGRTAAEVSQSLFEQFADDIIEKAAEKATDYEKLLYIHDRIVDNTVYTDNGERYNYEADGPLVYGKAVCEGYSKAFMYLAQSVGIDCVCVIGKANDEEHMWNLVKLYGEWYNVDVTWDDPVRSDGANVLRHNYFLVSDYDISDTHELEEIVPVPSAPNTYVD